VVMRAIARINLLSLFLLSVRFCIMTGGVSYSSSCFHHGDNFSSGVVRGVVTLVTPFIGGTMFFLSVFCGVVCFDTSHVYTCYRTHQVRGRKLKLPVYFPLVMGEHIKQCLVCRHSTVKFSCSCS